MKYRLTILVTALLLCAGYATTIRGLIEQWSTDEDMGHGFLVPFVIAWVLYAERARWRALTPQPTAWGLVLLLAGGLLQLLSQLGVGLFAGALALVLSIVGAVLTLGGFPFVRAWRLPLFLLVFLLPKLAIVYNQATLPLQFFATKLAGGMLALAGFSVTREGAILGVGGHQVLVAEACNGIRFLLSLAFLSVVFAYLTHARAWMFAALLLSSIPLAIFANALRVASIAAVPALASGLPHELSGWLLFVCALGLLLLVRQGLHRFGERRLA